MKVLKKHWIWKSISKTLKKYWIWKKCTWSIKKVWKLWKEKISDTFLSDSFKSLQPKIYFEWHWKHSRARSTSLVNCRVFQFQPLVQQQPPNFSISSKKKVVNKLQGSSNVTVNKVHNCTLPLQLTIYPAHGNSGTMQWSRQFVLHSSTCRSIIFPSVEIFHAMLFKSEI